MAINEHDEKLLGNPPATYTIDDIDAWIDDESPKRIHFATSHHNALKPYNDAWKLKLPFKETIDKFIRIELGEDYCLQESKFGIWKPLHSEEEREKVQLFIEKYYNVVFLRDLLDLSIALDVNFESDGHTLIGDCEKKAKYDSDMFAEKRLTEIVTQKIASLPFYKDTDVICAMPNSGTEAQLPQRLVEQICQSLGKTDCSTDVKWHQKDKSLKTIDDPHEKLKAIDSFNIDITADVKGKDIVIVDDLYMSGVSMQYLGLKLKEAGAKHVFGLAIVKSLSN